MKNSTGQRSVTAQRRRCRTGTRPVTAVALGTERWMPVLYTATLDVNYI